MKTSNHWIDGRRDEREAERYGRVTDPATGDVTARVAMGGEKDVEAAVRAARRAFPA